MVKGCSPGSQRFFLITLHALYQYASHLEYLWSGWALTWPSKYTAVEQARKASSYAFCVVLARMADSMYVVRPIHVDLWRGDRNMYLTIRSELVFVDASVAFAGLGSRWECDVALKVVAFRNLEG